MLSAMLSMAPQQAKWHQECKAQRSKQQSRVISAVNCHAVHCEKCTPECPPLMGMVVVVCACMCLQRQYTLKHVAFH